MLLDIRKVFSPCQPLCQLSYAVVCLGFILFEKLPFYTTFLISFALFPLRAGIFSSVMCLNLIWCMNVSWIYTQVVGSLEMLKFYTYWKLKPSETLVPCSCSGFGLLKDLFDILMRTVVFIVFFSFLFFFVPEWWNKFLLKFLFVMASLSLLAESCHVICYY